MQKTKSRKAITEKKGIIGCSLSDIFMFLYLLKIGSIFRCFFFYLQGE